MGPRFGYNSAQEGRRGPKSRLGNDSLAMLTNIFIEVKLPRWTNMKAIYTSIICLSEDFQYF